MTKHNRGSMQLATEAQQLPSMAMPGGPPVGDNHTCPICRMPPSGPFATRCGHIFCYECITRYLSSRSTCPLCSAYISVETLVPRAPLTLCPMPQSPATPVITGELSSRPRAPPPLVHTSQPAPSSAAMVVRRARVEAAVSEIHAQSAEGLSRGSMAVPPPAAFLNDTLPDAGGSTASAQISWEASLSNAANNMTAERLSRFVARLSQRMLEMEGSERRVETELLLDFLDHMRSEKEATVKRLVEEIALLNQDTERLRTERTRQDLETSSASNTTLMTRPGRLDMPDVTNVREDERPSLRSPERKQRGPHDPSLNAKRRRLARNFDTLESHYFSTVGKLQGDARRKSLNSFVEDIHKLTRYSRFRCLVSLIHVARASDVPCTDVFRASNIVSSIEFDRESEFLAAAGVSKRIKIFEFANITRNLSGVHYPVKEIIAPARLSWVCWNPYIRNHLVSSDYEGVVTLWDVNRGTALHEFEEHERRAWSVDYCTPQPTLFASGSDDGRVKLWTTSHNDSVLTIENQRANICSVKFHPTVAEKIAFGSADHNVHYYDLRNTREPLHVFSSHSQTVSYVKFMSPTELVSASVDSTVKLWDLETMALKRTFVGHVNDKNFVGLSVTPDYIACGSEKNSVYAYYKGIPRPFASYRFASSDALTGEEMHEDDDMQFISSVCWCPKHPTMLVGANSLGVVKVLELKAGDLDSDEEAEAGPLSDTL